MQSGEDVIKARFQEALGCLIQRGLVRTQKDVGDKMGTDRSAVSLGFSGRPRYSTRSFTNRFNTAFGGIFNESYLLGGEGTLLKGDTLQLPAGVVRGADFNPSPKGTLPSLSPESADGDGIVLTEKNAVTYYPNLVVTGSDIDGFTDNELHQDRELWRVPGLEGCSAFPLEGESMMPTIHPRSIVAHKPWTEGFIENGALYVIVTRSGHRMTKRLRLDGMDDDGAKIFTCMSDNPDQNRYAPFTINGNDIVYLGIVKGTIDVNVHI